MIPWNVTRMLKNTRQNVVVANTKSSINVAITDNDDRERENGKKAKKIREGKDSKGERGMRRQVEIHCDVITVLIRGEVGCYVVDKWVLAVDGENDG